MSVHIITEKTAANVAALVERIPRDGTIEIEIRKKTDPRTREQNRYLHLLLRRLSGVTGIPIESCKTYCVMRFVGPDEWIKVNGEDVPVLPSTSSLDKHRMSELLEQTEAFAVEKGVEL